MKKVSFMDNNENNFKKQIADDIVLIQEQFGHIDEKIMNDEYAFNYWVLSRLYSLDEEIIPSNVTDINDKGIDCFVHYEDTKELFLIQNKYDSENTAVPRDNVSDFLYTPLRILLNGEYKKSSELQKIFDRAISDSEYKIYLHFYVTNEYKSSDIQSLIDKFSYDPRIEASVYAKYLTLSDIKRIYFDDRFTEKTNFKAKLPTRRAATSLDVRPGDYELEWMIDLRYVLVNVVDIYKIYQKAVNQNYELFEENIREYLGTQGINNGIIKTLKDRNDRENFFYYNNGITIICEKCETLRGNDIGQGSKNIYGFELYNPQIVNGCQTVNSIAEVLSHYTDDKLKTEFEKTFVLVKVFIFDQETKAKHPDLDVNIVKYTNSQNAINDKAFASKKNYFINIQREFENRGLLLLVKQSDKYKFKSDYDNPAKSSVIRSKSKNLFDFFDIEYKNYTSAEISLEKFLKVLLAFVHDGFEAYKNGNHVLKPNSPIYKEFSLNIDEYFTIDNMVRLFFTYLKADEQRKNNDKRHPIPYYLLSFMGYTFKGKTFKEINQKLDKLFSDKAIFNEVYNFYASLTEVYSDNYKQNNKADYNVMIKQEIDISTYESSLGAGKKFGYPENVKWFMES